MKMYFRNILRACVFIMILILSTGCGAKKEEEQGQEKVNREENAKKEKKTEAEPDQENHSETPIANPLIPRFQEQVIFDQDGLKLTAIFNENSGYPDADFHNLLHCKVENNTKKNILVSSQFLETKDHFFMPLINQSLEIPAGTKDMVFVHFNPSIHTFDKIGHDYLYLDYGLGETLGNFRLHILIMEAESYDHLMNITTEYIKTENPEALPDYSLLHEKPLLIDQKGIKVYWVDQFFLPVEEYSYFEQEAYFVVNYYENETDDTYVLNYDANMMNGQEAEADRYVSTELHSQGRGFFFIYLAKEDLTKKGFDEPISIDFTANALKLGRDENSKNEDYFQTDLIHLDFSQPWKNIR